MIPRTIELKNFLSYGDQPQIIDFKGYNLICLSGKNGHGKSALLDALTWAIWGQARKTSGIVKADEGLLRLGQTKMLVSTEFEFNNQIYRVRREFAKTYGKPYALLDFEIFDQTRNNFSSLTEKTVKATQEKIELLLGLDYETFINTSFLRQGQANEFSKKNPKERKHILATILGLSKYDILQQQAQEQVRHYQDEKKILQALIEQSTQEIAQEQTLLDQLKKEAQRLEMLNNEYTTLQTNIQQIEQKKTVLIEYKKQFFTLQQELENLNHVYQEKTTLFLAAVTQWKQIHKITLHLPNLKNLEQEKQQLLEQERHQITLQQKRLLIQEEQLGLKEKLQQHTSILKNNMENIFREKKLALEKYTFLKQQLDHTTAQKQSQLAETQQKKLVLQHELALFIKKSKSLPSIKNSYQNNKKQFDKRHSFYQALREKGNWLKNTLQEFEHKKKLVTDTVSPSCPLCEQILTAKRKQFLGIKLVNQEHFFNHQFQRVAKIISRLKQILVDQHQQLETIEKECIQCQQQEEQIRSQQVLINDLIQTEEQQVKELTIIQQQTNEVVKNYTTLSNDLSQNELSLQKNIQQDSTVLLITNKLERLEQEKQKIFIDETMQTKIHNRLQEIEKHLKNVNDLKDEQQKQIIRLTTVQHVKQELKALKERKTKLQEQQQHFTPIIQQETAIATTLEQLKTNIIKLEQIKNECEHQKIKLINELTHIEKIKYEQATKKERIIKNDQEIEDYQTLATAFSKNGIQALLIEEAIPEIEQEANMILSRLTDNQAQIFIESLRDLKSGGVKESLDIHISDATGIRPYEMYSGGEAFRIDFSLRIAISKLLARRAGTALQTLIIDEGFGSQDEEGLTRIMDAIHSIKNDFSKIIIVSHLPELKDNFPVHFIVEKQTTGSIIQIEERG